TAGAIVNALNHTNSTPLHCAASRHPTTMGSRSVITELLISAGANVNAIDANGKTPLAYAAGLGYSDIIFLLLIANADINLVLKAPEHASPYNDYSRNT